MTDLLNLGTTALSATQTALSTTSHNISNINTEGYSRQRAEFATHPANFEGGFYVGSGVNISTVERMFDNFLAVQVRVYTSQEAQLDTFNQFARQLDDLLSTPELSVSKGMEDFFNAVHEVANDPTSIPARQVMLSQAEIFTSRLNTLDQQLESFKDQVNSGLDVIVKDINVMSKSISNLNQAIIDASGGGAVPPNDLLDQRDQILNELSALVSVDTTVQDDGSINVFIGNGQALVVGNTQLDLSLIPNPTDPLQQDIGYGASQINVTKQITGGQIGGLLSVRSDVILSAQTELDNMAAGVASVFNEQHQKGITLSGSLGGEFFTVPTIGTVDAGNIRVALTDARDIAVGLPVSIQNNVANAGTGQIEIKSVDGTTPFSGVPPTYPSTNLSFSFDGTNYTITDNLTTETASFAYDPSSQSGLTVDLASLVWSGGTPPDLTVTISGVPQVTDTFALQSVDLTGIAVGDNRNALAMADIQTSKTLDPNGTGSNTHSFGDVLGVLVANVATRTHQSEAGQKTQQGLLDQTKLRYETVSGVNLDEEAANLIKFQQAYQAAAQIIKTANTIFDTLLRVV